MLKTESVLYGGKEYIRTWSDLGMKIERDGCLYEEAVDPVGSGRTYKETSTPVFDMNAEYLAGFDIPTGP